MYILHNVLTEPSSSSFPDRVVIPRSFKISAVTSCVPQKIVEITKALIGKIEMRPTTRSNTLNDLSVTSGYSDAFKLIWLIRSVLSCIGTHEPDEPKRKSKQ